MEKFWKQALSIAGIAAIGFFVFLSLYKQWLNLPIFSQMSQDQTFAVMIIFLILVFLALLLGLVFHYKEIAAHNASDEEWILYQVAFLWNDVSPPGIEEHFKRMTPEIEKTKRMLHEAVNAGQLKTSREVQTPNGLTRWVTKRELKRYAKLINEKPKFLQ